MYKVLCCWIIIEKEKQVFNQMGMVTDGASLRRNTDT